MTGIFSLTPSHLGTLIPEAATKCFRNLLWSEARRVGISPHKIVISLKTDIADGGIDARVNGNPTADSVLAKGLSYFQIKAGHAFKPWLRTALKKELFGASKAKPSKKGLAPGIRECLTNRGRYLLVSFGHDLTPAQQSTAKKTLIELLRSCGYRNFTIDVLGQGQLLGLISLFPSLALDILGKGSLSFLTVDEWKARADMSQPLQLSDAQNLVIEKLQDGLRGNKYKHLRVIGEPGLGKTRLVLEAVSADDLAPMVFYVPHAEDFQRGQLFNELLRKNTAGNAILVIDECSERERASIWNALRQQPNIHLVTIDHGPEKSRDEAMLVLDIPQLGDEQIKAVLASYLSPGANVTHWISWCEGSPRVAHAVGDNLKRNPEDLLKEPATVPIWERFIAGYEKLDDPVSQDTLTVLRHIGLFTKFGFGDPVTDEARFIWQLVQQTEPSITWQRFQSLVERLRERRILQGWRTLFIVPKALHIFLWINYWNFYGRGFAFQEFFERVPSQLQNWFLQFFIYGHASPVARDTIATILSPGGPFSDHDFFRSKAGTRFISYLAEADPTNTLELIERTIGHWDKKTLLAFKDTRQDIVWALEKIAVWKEHFHRATKVLIRLSLTENSNYANNSVGTLRGLFLTGLGWAPTQSPPGERFPIIEELLNSQLEEEVELGLSLCEQWLSSGGAIRVVGAEYQGLRPELEFWKPKIWKELFDAWLHCFRHLCSISRNWKPPQRQQANRVLVDAGLDLVNYKPIFKEILQTLASLDDDSATDKRDFTRRLIHRLRYSVDKLPSGALKGLRGLDKALTGQSFWGRFSRYVLNTNWDEDYSVDGDKIKELPTPLRRVKKLVHEVVKQPSVLTQYLPRIVSAEGHRLSEFGRLLAEKLNDDKVVRQLIEAQMKADLSKNTEFIGGYFSGFREIHPSRWDQYVHDLLASEQTIALGVTVVQRSGTSASVLQTLLRMFRLKTVDSSVFSRLAWNAAKEGFSVELVEEVLSALVGSNDEQSFSVAIELADYYFFNKEVPRSCDEALLFSLITAPCVFGRDRGTRAGYEWFTVTRGFRIRYPNRDLELLNVILSRHKDNLGVRSSSYPTQVADAVARDHPNEAWEIVSKILESDEQRNWSLELWLAEESSFDEDQSSGAISIFDPEIVTEWVKKDPNRRVQQIMRCLPRTLDEGCGGKLTRLFIETFSDSELDDWLISHLYIGGRSGPESAYLISKRDKARNWVTEIKSGKILAWLYRYIEQLNQRIEEANTREERGF